MNGRLQPLRRVLRPILYFGRYVRHRVQPRATYAAESEDVAAELLLGRIATFIDVGANDGVTLSNTARLALRGARGLCFEPNPADYRRLQAFYQWTKRVECIAEGLSDRSSTLELRSDGLLSAMTATEDAGLTKTLAKFNRPDAPLIKVPVEKLSTWLERRPDFRQCDLLSIDVEGHELSVLKGNDWGGNPKPARCLVIETHSRSSTEPWLHRDYAAIEDLLSLYRYVKLADNHNNTFWLHRDDWDGVRVDAAKQRLPGYNWHSH